MPTVDEILGEAPTVDDLLGPEDFAAPSAFTGNEKVGTRIVPPESLFQSPVFQSPVALPPVTERDISETEALGDPFAAIKRIPSPFLPRDPQRRASFLRKNPGAETLLGSLKNLYSMEEEARKESVGGEYPKFDTSKSTTVPGALIKEAANVALSVPEFLETPVGGATIPASIVAPVPTALAFTGMGAKGIADTGTELGSQWDEMTMPQKAAALGVNIPAQVAMTMLPLHGAVRPPSVRTINLEPIGVQNATRIRENAGQVPTRGTEPQGRAGQSGTNLEQPAPGEPGGAARSETTAPQEGQARVLLEPKAIGDELGARFDGEIGMGDKKLWQFTAYDNAGKESTSFSVDAGSSPAQIREAYDAARTRYEGEPDQPRPAKQRQIALDPSKPTADEFLKMTPDELTDWKREIKYGPDDAARFAEGMTDEQVGELTAMRDSLRERIAKANEAMAKEGYDDAKFAKAGREQLKAQTLNEIILEHEKQRAATAEPVMESRSESKPLPVEMEKHLASEARPSFQQFIKGKKTTGLTPGEVRDHWAESVWERLTGASGKELTALAKQLRLSRAIRHDVPDIPAVEGTPSERAKFQQQDRANVIARIGERLIGEAAPDAAALSRETVHPEDVGFKRRGTQPAFRAISPEEAADPNRIGLILTQDAREKGMPVSATTRLLALRDRGTGEIHLVSTFRDRRGPVAVDPAQAGKARPNEPIPVLLRKYQPLYSIRLDDPVQNFHQKFGSLTDFGTNFGAEAQKLTQEHQASLQPTVEGGPTMGRAGVQKAVPGEFQAKPGTLTSQEPITQPEAVAVAKHLLGEEGSVSSAEDVQTKIEELEQAVKSGKLNPAQRVVLSGLRKIVNDFARRNPDISDEIGYEALVKELYESTSGKGIIDAAKSLGERGSGTAENLRPTPPAESGPEYEEIGHDGETALESRAVDVTGLPPEVPNRGPAFAAELMEASRQLGALVRSRVTLAPGVLGRFIRSRAGIKTNDKIEVGDIQNQNTVAHEIGHDLDGLLFPQQNFGKSQASLAARISTGTAKELHNELVGVSELMRGPIAGSGSRGHQAYRRSATELLADYFGLYAHDPVRARAMAPKFSEGYENALARHPDAQGVIHQLHEGGIDPLPPKRASGPAATPTQTPGAVPARPEAKAVARDRGVAIAAENLVKGEVRRFEAELQGARIKADKWRENVPDRDEREDVGAFIEGIGNVAIPGDTIAGVQSRMTPQMKALAKQYRFDIELQRQRVNSYLKGLTEGEYLKFLEDYLAHFYANNQKQIQGTLGRFIKESPNAKQRKLPTLQEAVDLGLIPITQDPATLYEHTARINWRVATNRKVLGELKDMRTTSGEPVVVPAKDAPPGWHITDNPLVQRVYARPTASGDLMLWRGGAAIHPDAWRAVRQILDTPVSSDLAKAYDAINGLTRANAFAFSLFHDLTLRSASLGAQMSWYNPARGLFRLFERNPVTGELEAFRSTRSAGKELMRDEEAVSDAALHGLKFSWTDSESYQKNARAFLDKAAAKWRDIPVLGKATKLARDIQHMRQQGLWKNTHDAYKVIAYHDAVAKALQDAPPGVDAKAVKENVASLLNDAFGGQEWQTKFWLSPQVRLNLSRFFLAPDWTLSTVRSVPLVSDAASVLRGTIPRLRGQGAIPTAKEGVRGNVGRTKFWAAEIAALATATVAAQYAIYSAFGDKRKGDKPWIWENEAKQNSRVDITPLMRKLPWRDPNDPNRYYVNLGKRPEEIMRWFTSPEQNILSKSARPVAEIFKQVTGSEGDFKAEWKRDHETFLESLPSRALSAGSQFIPFTFAGNQFALSVPYRKGMTKYKAQEAYESAYELIAEPSRVRQMMRGISPKEGALDNLLDQISDAAERNGVPYEEMRKRAVSAVRGHHYNEYFKALQKDDFDKAEKEAEALIRLGATLEGMNESIRRRMALEPQ